ncbi:MAG: L,D-transpeptidase family protein [Pseudomonadota bacterium]
MFLTRRALMGGMAIILAACGNKFRTYDGPKVTQIVVLKEKRIMALLHGMKPLRRYNFELGFAPVGDKDFEGDGKTPEGRYYIDRKNPNSQFYLSLGISYPNAADRAKARAQGKSPGGDIFIHGTPRNAQGRDDWTWGCIAVTNREMEDIYAMVDVGTPITIYP